LLIVFRNNLEGAKFLAKHGADMFIEKPIDKKKEILGSVNKIKNE
jgi:hypothetical protein